MVATRMVCDRLSVDTPSRAAKSARGWMRSSGRSSEVSEITLAICGIRFIWLRQFAGDVGDDVAVGPGHHQLHRALAVLVEEPVPDVRHVFEVVG